MPSPSFVCARIRRWGLVGGSAVHAAMQRVQLAAQPLAVLSELVRQRYERREGLPLDRAADLLVQHLAQHQGEAARVREVVCQGLGPRCRVVDGASRLVDHSGFFG